MATPLFVLVPGVVPVVVDVDEVVLARAFLKTSPSIPTCDPLAEGTDGLQALYAIIIESTTLILKIFVFMLEAPLVADSVICFWN